MGKLFKIILGVILLYIGGKMVYNNLKPKKEEKSDIKIPLDTKTDDIDF